MAATNPGTAFSTVTSAGAQTAVDLLGGATTLGVCYASMVVVVTGMTVTEGTHPYASIGLEVSLDNTTFLRVGKISAPADGDYVCASESPFPFRYARGVLDTLDANITAITVNGDVAGSA